MKNKIKLLFVDDDKAFSKKVMKKELTRLGLFEVADKGTLFLNEVSELPINIQAKLLRVLESGEICRLGDSKVIFVDTRIITATI